MRRPRDNERDIPCPCAAEENTSKLGTCVDLRYKSCLRLGFCVSDHHRGGTVWPSSWKDSYIALGVLSRFGGLQRVCERFLSSTTYPGRLPRFFPARRCPPQKIAELQIGKMGFELRQLWSAPEVNPLNKKAKSIPVFNPVNKYGRVFFFSYLGFFIAFWSWYVLAFFERMGLPC